MPIGITVLEMNLKIFINLKNNYCVNVNIHVSVFLNKKFREMSGILLNFANLLNVCHGRRQLDFPISFAFSLLLYFV